MALAGLGAEDPKAVQAGVAIAVGSGVISGLLLAAVNRGIGGLAWSSVGPILLLALVVYAELDEQGGEFMSSLRPWFLAALLPVEAGYVAGRVAAWLFRDRA